MAFKVEKFVVTNGVEKFPSWINEEAAKGRIKINYDDLDNICIIVSSGTKTYKAKHGDVIMLTKSGMIVLTGEQAKKYKVNTVQHSNVKKQEENENEDE